MKVALFLTLVALGAAGADDREYKEHLSRVWAFSCKEPQKRAIPVSTLKTLPSDEQYFPEVTVLHRCDRAAGRCPQGEGYGCGPAETEEVSLVFLVRRALPKSRANRRDSATRYETITAVNHTLCECQLLSDMPK